MSDGTELVQDVQGLSPSPFDKIRRVRPDGSEYWSARELMPLLGYERWENFAEAIERAKQSMSISQPSLMDSAFVLVTQLRDAGNLGKQERVDVELIRMACYFVALNGDVRKQEIADAQAYFVISTRENEVRKAQPAELSRKEILRLAMEAEEARERAEALAQSKTLELEAAAPKIEAFDHLMDAEGLYSFATAAQALGVGRDKLIAKLAELGFIIVRPNHSDHLRPYQKEIQAGRFQVKIRVFDVTKEGQSETRTEGTTRITPKGLAHIRPLVCPPRSDPQQRLF